MNAKQDCQAYIAGNQYWCGALLMDDHASAGLKAVMPLEAAAGPAKLSMSLVCEATTEGCKAALAAAGDCPTLTCGVSVEPSQAPVTLVILLGDDELQARVRCDPSGMDHHTPTGACMLIAPLECLPHVCAGLSGFFFRNCKAGFTLANCVL